MAPRAISSAKISFGLVTIPVHIYTAAESSAKISFNWIHKESGKRVKQRFYSPETGKVVEREALMKGYEFRKGEFVLFTPEEIKALEAEGDQTLEITEFVPLASVKRQWLSKVYYLGPDKGGDKPYHLLNEALKKTKLCAVGRHRARGKEYLVVIRPEGDGLLLEQLHYADELKNFSEIPLGKRDVKASELKLAVELVQRGAGKTITYSKYKDSVREKMLKAIEKKINGDEITRVEAAPKKKAMDLMEALQISLDTYHRAKKKQKSSQAAKRKPKKKRAL